MLEKVFLIENTIKLVNTPSRYQKDNGNAHAEELCMRDRGWPEPCLQVCEKRLQMARSGAIESLNTIDESCSPVPMGPLKGRFHAVFSLYSDVLTEPVRLGFVLRIECRYNKADEFPVRTDAVAKLSRPDRVSIAMKTQTQIIACFLTFALAIPAAAQRPGGGDRGGFSGRGGSSEGGGFRGGPPGGGFSGRGGSSDGSSSRGSWGSRGSSSRGGFDPSSFLSRLDTNGNGVLDPDEQQGPAQFMIQRMQSSDPSIKAGQPIPLKKITDSFQKMREQREGGGDSAPQASRSSDDDILTAELLVPGFGIEMEPMPLMGFGATAEMMSVAVTAADEKEANDVIRRFDRNRDGVLSGDEISSRFSGNPLDFDRNKDGKLTMSELAVRYARRREGRQEAEKSSSSRRDQGRAKKVEAPDVFNGRKSYRSTAGRGLPEGVPGFFSDKDQNGDRQVTMAEFSSDWSDEMVRQFFASDLNRDGVITAEEALKAVENPGIGSAMASTSAPRESSAAPTQSSPVSSGAVDEKYIKVGQRIIDRYDKNGDKSLTASEWEKMLMSPADADANRDGRITVEEYGLWMMSREKK